jgi:hypothetical protein
MNLLLIEDSPSDAWLLQQHLKLAIKPRQAALAAFLTAG